MNLLRAFIRKKNDMAFAMAVMICACACALAIRDSFVVRPVGAMMKSAAPILIIDAGHGGIDGGAIGVDGTRESDINLAIAKKLYAAAVFLGKPSRMTRMDDSRGSDAVTYSEREELKYRVDVTNSVPNAVLISIHQNCYPTAQPSGAYVIYSGNGCSEKFGKLLQSNLTDTLDPQSRHLAEADKNRLYVLSHVNCPAALVECGFVSNHSDIGKLTDDRYQTALAAVLMASYIQFTDSTV